MLHYSNVPVSQEFLVILFSMNPTHLVPCFRGDIRELSDFAQTNTVRIQTPRRLTLRGVSEVNFLNCAECDSAWSFAGTHFVFAGISPCINREYKKKFKNICELFEHGPTFCLAF